MLQGKVIPRSNFQSGSVPTGSDLDPGELVLNPVDGFLFTKNPAGQVILLNPNAGSIPLQAVSSSFSTSPSRKRVTITTANLATSASATGSIQLDTEFMILGVSASINTRFRLYNTTGSQTQDSLRGIGIDPSASAGVILDVVFPNTVASGTNNSSMIVDLAPPAMGYGGDAGNFGGVGAVTSSIQYYIQNYTGGTQSCSVDIVWVPV